MKVLFDCILTADPNRCSTTAQFMTLAEMLLKEPNVFIYWPIPDRLTGDQVAQYPQSDRIKYIPVYQANDRMQEYSRMTREMENIVGFSGDYWDWDVMVTVRTPIVPLYKIICNSPRQPSMGWTRRIVIIEDMMLMTCKPNLAISNKEVQDRQTLAGYLAADLTLLPAYHQKEMALAIMKKYYTPSMCVQMYNKMKEVCHLNLPAYELKSKFRYDGSRKMNIAYTGRIEKRASRLESLNAVMRNQFIMHGDEVNCFICTVSKGGVGWGAINKDVIEIKHPPRDEFWRICREEMDLAMFFYVDVELNMSMLEPLGFGVPVIAKDAPWSRGMVGDKYPFLVDTEAQAYGVVSAFRKNYEEQYTKFALWWNEWFVPTYKKRTTEEGLYRHLMEFIMAKDSDKPAKLPGLKENRTVGLLAESGDSELRLFDKLQKLVDNGDFESLGRKLDPDDREDRRLVFRTPWNDLRLGLVVHNGYEDASTDVGHLKKL